MAIKYKDFEKREQLRKDYIDKAIAEGGGATFLTAANEVFKGSVPPKPGVKYVFSYTIDSTNSNPETAVTYTGGCGLSQSE